MPTTHIAAQQVTLNDRHLRQLCGWCGHTLIDYDLARIAVPLGQDPTPGTWPVGALVTVDGPASWVIDGDQLPDDACASNPLTLIDSGHPGPHPETVAQTWAMPDEPAPAITRVWDNGGYRWDRMTTGTAAEPSYHWRSVVGQELLWPDLLGQEGPITTRRPAPTPDETRAAVDGPATPTEETETP